MLKFLVISFCTILLAIVVVLIVSMIHPIVIHKDKNDFYNFSRKYKRYYKQKYALQDNCSYKNYLWGKDFDYNDIPKNLSEINMYIDRLLRNNKKIVRYVRLNLLEEEALKEYNNDKKVYSFRLEDL